jgi:hypothetical protein
MVEKYGFINKILKYNDNLFLNKQYVKKHLTPNKQTPKFQNFILKQNLQKKVQLLAI